LALLKVVGIFQESYDNTCGIQPKLQFPKDIVSR